FTVKLAKEDIHAKIYFFDEKVALVGSSNLTRNGFFDFYEIGTVIFGKDCQKIKIILCQMV
ncbi:MAG: phospholipase D-like domain-containing protein, partial [Candidatus Micrarchaeota archaeon]